MNSTPNPNDYDNFNDYLEAVNTYQPAQPTWVIKDTANDTTIMEFCTIGEAMQYLKELRKFEKAHGTYHHGRYRIVINKENNE